MTLKSFLLISAALFSVHIAGSPAEALSPRIINGGHVSTAHSPVVEVIRRASRGFFLCSGSIISPKAVLTASHCVTRNASVHSVVIAGRRFAVHRVRIHPNAGMTSDGLLLNDVAILFLSKPTSKPRLALLNSRTPASGDVVTISGYGIDEFGDTGVLRQGTSVVEQVSADFLVTIFASLNEANSCNGDSGGPAIFEYSDVEGVVHRGIVGTVSAGTSQQCGLGDETFYTNTQSLDVISFIIRYVPSVKIV